jgi:hypothetical protein
MAGPTVISSVVPTGGTIVLDITLGDPTFDINNTNITILRYTGSLSNAPVQVYTGPYLMIFFDDGVAQPSYLDFNTTFYYAVTDPTGTTTTPSITPTPQLVVFSDYLDKLMFRMFSAGMSALAVPADYNPIRVLNSLPLTMGSEATKFPFVVMNLDLEQQEHLQIGEDIDFSFTNLNIIPMIIMKRYSLNILSHNAMERDFYKDSAKGVILTMMQSLTQIGQDFSYNWQASNTQESAGIFPGGFYCSVVMLEMTGQFNVSMNTNYPVIDTIAPVITDVASNVVLVSGIVN